MLMTTVRIKRRNHTDQNKKKQTGRTKQKKKTERNVIKEIF